MGTFSYRLFPQRSFEDVDPSIVALTGRSAAEHAADPDLWLDLVHPDDVGLLRLALGGRSPEPVNLRFVVQDGSTARLELTTSPAPDASGRVVALRGRLRASSSIAAGNDSPSLEPSLELARAEANVRTLIEDAPDAVIVVDRSGSISFVNHRVEQYFGYDRDELLGRPLETLVPERFRDAHRAHRERYAADPHPRPMGTGLDLFGLRRDGTEFAIDVSLMMLDRTGSDALMVAFVRDVSERKQSDDDKQRLRENELLRRQALEINDVIVQGITTAVYALDLGEAATAADALRSTLSSARQMMGDLVDSSSAPAFRPGELLRGRPALVRAASHLVMTPPVPVEPQPTDEPSSLPRRIRVVLADDTPDVRLLVRYALGAEFEVVGEAENGREAIDLVEALQPDALLLDLAMPVMDGLEALPHIRSAAPRTKVVVLSGYGREMMGDEVMAAGADAYLEKGRPLRWIPEMLRELCGDGSARAPEVVQAPVAVEAPPVPDDDVIPIDEIVHEIRSPLTVLRSVTDFLSDGIDDLPAAQVQALLGAMKRNVDHLIAVADDLSDVRHPSIAEPVLTVEPCDITEIVNEAVADVSATRGERRLSIDGLATCMVDADPIRVRQIVINLLANAIKFGNDGSEVRIDVGIFDGRARVAVKSVGPTIPDDQREHVFEKFGRLDAHARGLGLGLFISRRLARALGGDVVLERSDGDATTFSLVLPVSGFASSAGA